jgi:hypothetical protein
MPQLTVDAEVLAIEPHPDQATHNPSCWAVQFRVSHAGETRTFWRWHSMRTFNENGRWIDSGNEPPSADAVLKQFWDETFNDLHGFNFRDGLFNNLNLHKSS